MARDMKVILAFRAGQLHQQGMSIEDAFKKAAQEEHVLQEFAIGLARYNQALDRLIEDLERQRDAARRVA